MDQVKNFAKGVLSAGYDEVATSIVLESGHGARFPTVPFNAVWWNATNYPDPADDPNVEIVRVTARSTDTLTISRAQESTVATPKDGPGVYYLIAPLTAKVINTDLAPVGRLADDGTTFRINPAESIAAEFNRSTSVAVIGDVDGVGEGTKITINDPATTVTITKQLICPDTPSSDPAIAGAFYYDPVTGNVKRSAG